MVVLMVTWLGERRLSSLTVHRGDSDATVFSTSREPPSVECILESLATLAVEGIDPEDENAKIGRQKASEQIRREAQGFRGAGIGKVGCGIGSRPHNDIGF